MNVLTQNQNNYSLYGSHCVAGLISTLIGFLLFYLGAHWADKSEYSGPACLLMGGIWAGLWLGLLLGLAIYFFRKGSEGGNQSAQTTIYSGYSPYLRLEN